jgi:hypothetical protein
MPFDSNMPCILTLTFVKSPSKSDLLSDRQYVDPESIAMGNKSVSKSTPSGNTLTKDDAYNNDSIFEVYRTTCCLGSGIW